MLDLINFHFCEYVFIVKLNRFSGNRRQYHELYPSSSFVFNYLAALLYGMLCFYCGVKV